MNDLYCVGEMISGPRATSEKIRIHTCHFQQWTVKPLTSKSNILKSALKLVQNVVD